MRDRLDHLLDCFGTLLLLAVVVIFFVTIAIILFSAVTLWAWPLLAAWLWSPWWLLAEVPVVWAYVKIFRKVTITQDGTDEQYTSEE